MTSTSAKLVVPVFVVAVLLAARPLSAADVSWVATTNNGDWANTNNWSGGVLPGVSDNAFLTNGRQAWLRLTNTSPTISNLTVSNSGTGLRLFGNTGVLSVSGAITVTGGRITTSLVGGNASNSTYYAIQTPLIDATNATLELSPPGTATWLTAGPGSTWNFKSIDVNTGSTIGDASAGANFRINGATVNVGFDNVTAYGLMLSRNSNAVSSLLVESGTLTAYRIGIGRQQNNFQNAGTGSVEWSGGTIGNLAGQDLLINSYDITDNYGLAINLTNAGDKTLSVESGRIARIGPNARNFDSGGAIAGTNTSGAYFTGSEGRLVIVGGGTVRLYQSNSYTGQVKIDNGTLTLVSGSETFDSTEGTYSASIAPSAVEIATNGTLDLQNGTGLGGSGTVSFTGGLLRFSSNSVADLSARIANSTGAIRIDTGTNTVTFASALVSNNTGGLSKTGNGTLVLTASNAFTGAVAVQEGVLSLSSTTGSAVGAVTGLSVATNATLLISQSGQVSDTADVTLSGGTIQRASGVSEVFGNLNVSSASFLDFGSSTEGTLSFGTYTASALLTVNNFFQGNVLTFGTDLTGSINNTNSFNFDNAFTSSWNEGTSTFTITAIPEPSTVGAALGLLGLLLAPVTRRFLRRHRPASSHESTSTFA